MSAAPRLTPCECASPAPRPWRWLRRPCWPCVLLPAGQPGVLEIGDRAYAVLPLGEYPSRGFRVTSDRGDCYDLDAHTSWGGWACDCPDATYRNRECKHVRAVREAVASLFHDSPAPDAIDADALADCEASPCCWDCCNDAQDPTPAEAWDGIPF